MERRSCARTFARPPLRRRFPRNWWPGKASGMKRLRADFCAPSFEERRSPGIGGQEGPMEGKRARADFCAPSFEERRFAGIGDQEGPVEERGCARTFARPPLRSAFPPGLVAGKDQWKERSRADFCAPSFEVPPGLVARKGQ